MKGIDLYSGIGGWTLGMKFSKFKNVNSFEWNKDSLDTHNKNFGTSLNVVDIRKLKLKDLPGPGELDFVVGSPPCTQFSYSNRGGSGDISDGLVDVYKFLEIVEYTKPKFWVMENVPRVKKIIDQVISEDKNFKKFKSLIKFNQVVNISDYGVPQKRKRMICGDFPFETFLSYKGFLNKKTLGDVVKSLNENPIKDPNYNISLNSVVDHNKEVCLSKTEKRVNQNNKISHHIYNKMSFPDRMDVPSRTITSTCTRVSRESIIVEENKKFRRLTLREKGCVQGFPINFQFFGNTFSSKEKMIGNSIPPILTYLIFESMKGTPVGKLKFPDEIGLIDFSGPEDNPQKTPPPTPKNNYNQKRRFRFCIPNLRLGSGVRFELNNMFEKDHWGISFFYGNSKSIYELKLNKEIKLYLEEILNEKLEIYFQKHSSLLSLKSNELQDKWISKENNFYPFKIIDEIGNLVIYISETLENKLINMESFHPLFDGKINKKIIDNFNIILTGLIVGTTINLYLQNEG